MLRQINCQINRRATFSQIRQRFLSSKPTIYYTETDEAPALATYSLLPIIQRMAAPAGIDVVKSDISLSARIIGQFPKYLKEEDQNSTKRIWRQEKISNNQIL